MREKLSEFKEKVLADAHAIFEAEKAKKKPKKGVPVEEFDPSKVFIDYFRF